MSEEGRVSLERRGRVVLIGLNRAAKRNAFDQAMFAQLGAAYAELEEDDEARCGVLFAHGDHFTAGLDLAQVTPVVARGQPLLPEGVIDPWGLSPPYRAKPMVAAVQGWCLTLGIELLLAADVRVASADARFAQLEVRRGIYPFGGATIRFVREAGWGNAMRWMLTGDEFGAEEALRMGIVQEVVEPGCYLERAIELAQNIADQAPLGVRATLDSARRALFDGEEQVARHLAQDAAPLLESEDAREGLRSFIERRKADFVGR
jgi:enoyl-CoA hydratase/carnithine racemase